MEGKDRTKNQSEEEPQNIQTPTRFDNGREAARQAMPTLLCWLGPE